MRTDRALALLSRENPVTEEELPARNPALRERILLEPRRGQAQSGRARRLSAAGAAAAVVAAVVALLMVGWPGDGRGVEDAAAAVRHAAAVTAESAKRSGTVVVRIAQEGELWAGETIRWHGHDLSLTSDSPDREGNVGSETLVVDGIVYGIDPEDGAWVNLGGHENIDPDSGTTPYEQLAAIREDVGGETLERITGGMTDLTTRELTDGSTVYTGSLEAGLIARETGFKEGQSIRVLPFGYVAHGEAENPDALLDAAVTVGADGIVRQIAVSWGTWLYTVAYSELGSTPAIKPPANARSLLRERGLD